MKTLIFFCIIIPLGYGTTVRYCEETTIPYQPSKYWSIEGIYKPTNK